MTDKVQQIAVDSIIEYGRNPRKQVDDAALAELADSIKASGVLQPIIVRPHDNGKGGKYELVAGWRRWKASRKAGLDTIPATVRELTDEQADEIRLVENLQREDVHPLDEAAGIAKLRKRYDWPTVAARLGKPERDVRQYSHLVNLIEEGRKLFLQREMGLEHALLICRQPEASQKQIIRHMRQTGGAGRVLSESELRRYIAQNENIKLSHAKFDPADAKLVPGAGACTTCPKRTGNAPLLFEEAVGEDVCTDRKCFDGKTRAYVDVTLEQLRKEATENKQPSPLRLTTESWNAPKGLTHVGAVAQAKEGSCPSVRRAIVTHVSTYGDDKQHLGKVATVCDNQSCAVHRPGRSYRSGFDSGPGVKPIGAVNSERKRELQLLTRRHVILSVADKAKWDRTLLHAATNEMWARVGFAAGRHIPFWMGWEKKPLPQPSRGYHNKIRAMKDAELLRFLTITTLAETWDSTYFGSRGGDLLPSIAKHYKVNWKKIEAQARLELKPKWARSDKARAGKIRKAKERAKEATAKARKAAKS